MAVYRQLPRKTGPVFPLPSSAPYISYWAHSTNQPLVYRKQARRQPNYRGPFYALADDLVAPPVSAWKRSTNQPVLYRRQNRKQPIYTGLFYGVADDLVAPSVSSWKQTTNQPQMRRRPRLIEISGASIENTSEAPYVSYWVQDVNQPLRGRVSRRQQPRPVWNSWIATQTITTILVSQWIHPVNQPLKNRITRRQQLPKLAPPFPALPSQAPYISYWKQPISQPFRRRITGRQLSRSRSPFKPLSVTSWRRSVNEPVIYRRQVRKQLIRGSGWFYPDIIPIISPALLGWKHPPNQPLRYNRQRRKQPSYINRGGYYPISPPTPVWNYITVIVSSLVQTASATDNPSATLSTSATIDTVNSSGVNVIDSAESNTGTINTTNQNTDIGG